MTVRELIDQLKHFPLDEEVLMDYDGHGLGLTLEVARFASHKNGVVTSGRVVISG